MQIIRGKLESAQKVVIYGPEGIGKSTFAAQFPDPIFIDTEGSTKSMDVARLPKPSSWTMLLEEVKQIRNDPSMCKTLVLDTADWAEQLCVLHVCSKAAKAGIEDFGYGKGYTYVMEEYGKLLNLLEEVVESGTNVVITAHASMRKVEQPEESGQYDRWEMKLSKQVKPLVKEWADMVLFANYKIITVKTETNKVKAQGGSRVMYTTHHPCWDAKNRHGLEPELLFDYTKIAHCIPSGATETPTAKPVQHHAPPIKAGAFSVAPPPVLEKPENITPATEAQSLELDPKIPQALRDLMMQNNVKPEEIQIAVASKRYYPADMPITEYDADFIQGVLIAAWPQVFEIIWKNRDIPF